jgi:hypothetical protein
MASIFAAFAVIARLVGGSKTFEGDISFIQLLVVEFGSGVVGGLIVGVTYKHVGSMLSAALVGLLVGLACGVAFAMADAGVTNWRGWDQWLVLAYTALGMVVAGMAWRRAKQLRAHAVKRAQ